MMLWAKTTYLFKIFIFLLPLLRAEDSLQGALNAVNRRQRDLSDYRRFGDYDSDSFSRYDDNENLGFLTSNTFNSDGKRESKSTDLDKALLDYLDKRGLLELGKENPNERISSSFRERVEKDRSKQRDKMAEILLNKLYNDDDDDENDEYSEQMQHSYDIFHKYPENFEDASNSYANKRSYYNSLGWDSVGMKKRSRYFQPDGPSDSLYLLNYAPRDEIFSRLEEENNPESEYNWNKYSRERKSVRSPFAHKRFPLTKRSSSNYRGIPYQTELTHQYKRSPMKDTAKTDPEVEKELSSIFNPKSKTEKQKKTDITKKPTVTSTKPKRDNSKKDNTKEEIPNSAQVEKPLEIIKKSINWSDYFGLDRRKKSNDDIDNEWLVERYHKSIATKRTDNYPLKIFYDGDETSTESGKVPDKQNKSEEAQIKDMDDRLKSIEDTIVDDALKYTGAHEGAVDSKEIQSIKDKIISRLAAAYRLEKMRRALNEYKQSLEREKARNQMQVENAGDEIVNEEKRVSVPRKQAVDEDRIKNTDEDNNIKCTQGDEDCDEQNYRPPSEVLDQTLWAKGECPKIERACNEVSSVLGHYGRIFEIACNMHQMCLICGDNSWYTPTRQCNILYLAKTDELCMGDVECQRAARQSVKYLVHINRSIRAEPFITCNLECPDKR